MSSRTAELDRREGGVREYLVFETSLLGFIAGCVGMAAWVVVLYGLGMFGSGEAVFGALAPVGMGVSAAGILLLRRYRPAVFNKLDPVGGDTA